MDYYHDARIDWSFHIEITMNSPIFSTSQNGFTLILGLGETGLAAAHWYLRQQLPVRLADTRPHYQDYIDQLHQQYEIAAIEVVLGAAAMQLDVLDGVQTVVLSPGLAVTQPEVAALLTAATERGIRVISEIELFAQALADLRLQGYQPKLLAVTGTNGKTTVTQMLKAMVQASGVTVRAAGNISPAALAALTEALDQDALPDFWVIELSSFQLQHTESLPVLAGTVLNLSQDHIDWHGSMAAYAQAKARLLSMSQLAIVNRDDAATLNLVAHHQVQSFGLNRPPQRQDMGVCEFQGQDWICTTTADGKPDYLLPAAALLVQGKHNLSNALAALALAHAAGLAWGPLLETLRHYQGEPHRCQFVRNIQGIDFINDSKGTNVGATVAAIEGLKRPLVLIAGGVGKGQDFAPLATSIQKSICRAVVLFGQDAQKIAEQLQVVSVPVELVSSLEQAVHQAFSHALSGDAVLLSPACASLDMFKNYIERGLCFIEAVTDLALDHGEVA